MSKSAREPRVDRSQQDLHDHAEHHGIERDAQSRIDVVETPVLTPRDRSIARKGKGAPGGCGCAADSADESEEDDRDAEGEGYVGRADGSCPQIEGQGLADGVVDDCAEIREGEHGR